MTPPRRAAVLIAVVAVAAAWSVPAPARSQPAIGAAPSWVARRAAWMDARESRRLARWNEPLLRLAAADRRAAAAESLYRSSLLAWTPDPSAVRVPVADLRAAALDLLEWGESERASLLLEGVLRDDEALLPIRAAARGRTGKAAEGLAILGWPTDRRLARGDVVPGARSGRVLDLAHLLTAAALAESIRDARSQRAALWAVLSSPDAGPAGRDEARRGLGRRFLADGTPRLAVAWMGDPQTSDQSLLLGDAQLAAGDSGAAVASLLRFGTKIGPSLSERYPSIRRAADLARPRANALDEQAHLDLSRTLGEVGEPDRGLTLLAARTRPASDSTTALARLEIQAGLLARAKRFTDAMAVYRSASATRWIAPPVRARLTLGFARAARGVKSFAPMDSAFLVAAALDSTGATGEQAAWERAREWEDQRTPAEAAAVWAWANARLRGPVFRSAGRVHGALAQREAGAADSARALVAGAGADDVIGTFWRGRLAAAAGDTAGAQSAYRVAFKAGPTTYEGLRAREELEARGLPIGAVPGDDEDRTVVIGKGIEEGASAPTEERVLTALGRDGIAQDRLRRCAREAGGAQAITCTDALEEGGTFRVGPRSILPSGRLDYPPAYPSEVLRAAEAESVSAALLWAVMRQESAYDRRARSKAGALGLLQLMPATASKLARRSVPADSLNDAALNVRLGARYIRALLAEFGDARAVLASYNAGEEAVRRWLTGGETVDEEWVERIPYRETRDYVKQVYANWRRYERLYGTDAASAPSTKRPAP